MILAPYDGAYIIPSFLTTLTGEEQKEFYKNYSIQPVLIKCPSTGCEFISMLTVYLVTLPNHQWEFLKNPMCLFKNCVKLIYRGVNYIIAGNLSGPYIEIYQKLSDKSQEVNRIVLTTVLQGLEKVKLLLNIHKSFDFSNISFHCKCSEKGYHTATYNNDLDILICEESLTSLTPNEFERSWLDSGQKE